MRNANTEIIIATALENMKEKDNGAFVGFFKDYIRAWRFWSVTKTGTEKKIREGDKKLADTYANVLKSRTYFNISGMCEKMTSMEILDMLLSDEIKEIMESRRQAIGF